MRTLMVNGEVLPLDGTSSVHEAIVLANSRVLGVGDRDAMQTLAGANATVVDLDGAAVIPGLIDTHPHLLHFAAIAAPLVDLADAVNYDDIVERIQARAAATPKGQWIMTTPVGEAHYYGRRSFRDLEERRLPNRDVLDRATTDHPVLIQAWAPRMPNSCAFNSAGLAAVHLSDFIPDRVCDVTIERDWNGRLTGILHGPVNNYLTYDPFWGQIVTKIALQTGAGTEANFGAAAGDVLTKAMAEANARGVTTVYECHAMSRADIAVYEQMRADGDPTVRVLTCLEPEAGSDFYPLVPCDGRLMQERMRVGSELRTLTDDFLRIDGLSLAPSGPCWSGHWWSHEPYNDPYGKPTYGTRFSPEENVGAFFEYCGAHNTRLNIVAGTYRDSAEFLDLAEATYRGPGGPDAAPRILQHAILMSPEHVRRYRDLGFKMTTSMSFSWGKGDMYGRRLGKHVWRDLIPLRRLLDAGMIVGAGTDWGPINPFEHVQLAETHEFCESGYRNNGPDQVVTREEALAMWTRDAARVLDWDGIGTLVPGNQADLVMVDRNPLTCDLDDLPGTRVLRTIVGGRTVHDSGELS